MNIPRNARFTQLTSLFVRKASTNVIVNKVGKVSIIGINRPEKRNAINKDTAYELKEAITNFENDPTAYAGVLHGHGGNFCAGYDLAEIANSEDVNTLFSEQGVGGVTMRYIKKPMVAAISGYAVAEGMELALMCDLRVMEETAVMGVFSRRFGVPLVDGGTVRLQAMVGLSRALDFLLTGRSISSKEAFECGLANRIVACGTSLGQAISLATSLVKFPQECMRADRDSTYNAAFTSAYLELLQFERKNGIKVFSEESVEGAKKFINGVGRHGKSYNLTEKDIPVWELEENEIKK